MVPSMIPINDPNMINQLESAPNQMTPVSDPNLLSQLNGTQQPGILSQIGQDAKSFYQNPLGTLGTGAYNALQGAGEALGRGAANALNIPIEVGNYLNQGARPSILPSAAPYINPNIFQAPQGVAADIGRFGGNVAGFALPGGLISKGIGAAEGLASTLPSAIPAAESFIGRTLGGATYGGATSPVGSRGTGAIYGGVGSAAPELATVGVNAAIPAGSFALNALTGTPNLSEAAQTMASQVGNLPIPYALKGLYNKVLGNIPLSGVSSQSGQIADAAQTQSNNILNTLRSGQDEGDIASNIQQAIKNNHAIVTKNNNGLYQNVADQADQQGITLNTSPNLSATAQQYLENSAFSLPDREQNLLKQYVGTQSSNVYDPTTMTNVPVAGGNLPQGPLSFNDAHALQKTFSKQAQSSYGSDNFSGKMYSDLSNALKSDMENAAQNSGNSDLYNNLLSAKQDFAQNVAPYRDNSIFPIVSGTKDLNSIQNSLTKTTPSSIKVLSDLSPDLQNQAGYLALNKAIKEQPDTGTYQAQPQKLFNAYNNFNEMQKNNLFTPGLRDQMRTLGVLNQYSKGTSGHLAGYTGMLEALPAVMELAHGDLAGIPHGLATLAATSIPARIASTALTNPALRNAYLSRTPGNYSYQPNILQPYGVAAASTLSNQQGGQQ